MTSLFKKSNGVGLVEIMRRWIKMLELLVDHYTMGERDNNDAEIILVNTIQQGSQAILHVGHNNNLYI
jgi:hypothetical protein